MAQVRKIIVEFYIKYIYNKKLVLLEQLGSMVAMKYKVTYIRD